jgi:hypothetical protein
VLINKWFDQSVGGLAYAAADEFLNTGFILLAPFGSWLIHKINLVFILNTYLLAVLYLPNK